MIYLRYIPTSNKTYEPYHVENVTIRLHFFVCGLVFCLSCRVEVEKSDEKRSTKKKQKPTDSNQLATVKLWSKLLADELSVVQDGPRTHTSSHSTVLLTAQLHRPAVTIDRKECPSYTRVQVLMCGICGKSSPSHKKIQDNEI